MDIYKFLLLFQVIDCGMKLWRNYTETTEWRTSPLGNNKVFFFYKSKKKPQTIKAIRKSYFILYVRPVATEHHYTPGCVGQCLLQVGATCCSHSLPYLTIGSNQCPAQNKPMWSPHGPPGQRKTSFDSFILFKYLLSVDWLYYYHHLIEHSSLNQICFVMDFVIAKMSVFEFHQR